MEKSIEEYEAERADDRARIKELEAENRPTEIAEKLDKMTNGVEAGDFLRSVWNDPSIEISLRIRAAEIAYKAAEVKLGKKDEKAERAKAAGQGKFQAGRPPICF